MKGETSLKKSDLKTGMIVRTEHNRFGVIELEKDRIYDSGVGVYPSIVIK